MTGGVRASLLLLSTVLAAWLAAAWLVGIRGDFPLSDDWAYAHVVRSLCEGRGFDFLPWTGASLVVQALYGAAACRVTGFSHETLRLTTLAMSAVGIAALYALLLELGARRRSAAFGAAVAALSPLSFNLSFTFMTDVPFTALALVASWLYVRALLRGSRAGLVTAGSAAALAFLVRQHALSIAVAAAMAAMVPAAFDGSRGRGAGLLSRLADAAAALALPMLVAAAYAAWVATSPDVPLAVHNKIGEAASAPTAAMAGAAFRALATLGFLFAPCALALRGRQPYERRATALAVATLAALASFLYGREGDAMFYLTNVLGAFTVGAVTTRDALFLAVPHEPAAHPALVLAVTAVAIASAGVLVARLATALPQVLGRRHERVRASLVAAAASLETFAVSGTSWSSDGGRRASVALFCVLALVLSGLGTLAQAHYYFDRYLVPLVPLAIAAVVAVSPGLRPRPAALVALALMSAYSIAGTHDYLAWNRARWDLLEALEARGVSAREIDGGVEYNASRLAAELRTAPTDAEARSGQPASAKSWWWVVDDRWVVAFTPLDGYRVADSRTYSRWLPPTAEGRVLLLEREPA